MSGTFFIFPYYDHFSEEVFCSFIRSNHLDPNDRHSDVPPREDAAQRRRFRHSAIRQIGAYRSVWRVCIPLEPLAHEAGGYPRGIAALVLRFLCNCKRLWDRDGIRTEILDPGAGL